MEPDKTALAHIVTGALPKSSTPPLCLGAKGTATADVFHTHSVLVEWVLDNDGYFHPQAQIAFSPRKGYHAVVADGVTLEKGTRVASCPMPVTLSVLNALDISPFSSHGAVFPKPFLGSQAKTPESLQAFFLMEQLILGADSWWAPYIATLPTVEDITAMQFEEDADLMWLDGTNLKGGLSTQAAKWKEIYFQGLGQLRQMGWQNGINGSYTWYAAME